MIRDELDSKGKRRTSPSPSGLSGQLQQDPSWRERRRRGRRHAGPGCPADKGRGYVRSNHKLASFARRCSRFLSSLKSSRPRFPPILYINDNYNVFWHFDTAMRLELQTPRRFHIEENFRGLSRALAHPLEYLPHLESRLFVTERAFDLDNLVHRFSELAGSRVISLSKAWRQAREVTLLLTISRTSSSRSFILSSTVEELNHPLRQNPRT